MDFGSKAWQEYYHGRNKDAHRPKSDVAQRQQKAFRHSMTKKGEAEMIESLRVSIESDKASAGKQIDYEIKRLRRAQFQEESFHRATTGNSMKLYQFIIEAFIERGIPAQDIIPRVNVLTFNAWKHVGRSVRKGEHGVKIPTWIPTVDKEEEEEGKQTHLRQKTAVVFHISQTEPIKGGNK